ncbi:MAG: Hint domain-containing protein [Pseudomonadota bacterium]
MNWAFVHSRDGCVRYAAPPSAAAWAWTVRPVSLLLELDLSSGARPASGPILHVARRGPVRRLLSLLLLDDGRLHLTHRAGPVSVTLGLSLTEEERLTLVRVSYVRASSGTARLTAEFPLLGRVKQTETVGAPGLDPGDVDMTCAREGSSGEGRAPEDGALAPDWMAAGCGAYPLGFGAALAGPARIATPYGPRRIDTLRPGDPVLTADGAVVPVLGVTHVRVPALGSFRPVRLAAPYHGLDSDALVSPFQRLALNDPEVEYQTGHDAVLIEARHLLDDHSAIPEDGRAVFDWHGLVLPRHDMVLVGGCAMETVDGAALLRSPRIAAISALAPFLSSLPRTPERRPLPREVHGAEARALVQSLKRRNGPLAA